MLREVFVVPTLSRLATATCRHYPIISHACCRLCFPRVPSAHVRHRHQLPPCRTCVIPGAFDQSLRRWSSARSQRGAARAGAAEHAVGGGGGGDEDVHRRGLLRDGQHRGAAGAEGLHLPHRLRPRPPPLRHRPHPRAPPSSHTCPHTCDCRSVVLWYILQHSAKWFLFVSCSGACVASMVHAATVWRWHERSDSMHATR